MTVHGQSMKNCVRAPAIERKGVWGANAPATSLAATSVVSVVAAASNRPFGAGVPSGWLVSGDWVGIGEGECLAQIPAPRPLGAPRLPGLKDVVG